MTAVVILLPGHIPQRQSNAALQYGYPKPKLIPWQFKIPSANIDANIVHWRPYTGPNLTTLRRSAALKPYSLYAPTTQRLGDGSFRTVGQKRSSVKCPTRSGPRRAHREHQPRTPLTEWQCLQQLSLLVGLT